MYSPDFCQYDSGLQAPAVKNELLRTITNNVFTVVLSYKLISQRAFFNKFPERILHTSPLLYVTHLSKVLWLKTRTMVQKI